MNAVFFVAASTAPLLAQYVYSFDGEGAITSAIDYVISDELPKLYSLEGHGEAELAVHVGRIREKIEDDPANPGLLQTVWGVGYRLNTGAV